MNLKLPESILSIFKKYEISERWGFLIHNPVTRKGFIDYDLTHMPLFKDLLKGLLNGLLKFFIGFHRAPVYLEQTY